MRITHALRMALGHQIGPFRFERAPGFIPSTDVPRYGLYAHIPFCRDICPFCPYYKIKYSPDYARPFLSALADEIRMVADSAGEGGAKRPVTSLYFGGGSPALMIDSLRGIRDAIDERYDVAGNAGIELHPDDVAEGIPRKLAEAGFDMVSVGIQSFSERLLSNLGRRPDGRNPLGILARGNFKAIDVDLIFGIPGQTEADLRDDFLRAAESGATQISTYPFIDFSYANNRQRPQGRAGQKALLSVLLKTADDAGFSRTSVWTFGKKSAPRYSSITRDCFLGFGPSATSLGRDAFKVNTFSVEAYIECVRSGTVPTALKMEFSPRSRRLYWLFWNCYNGILNARDYRDLFSTELSRDFSVWLKAGEIAGILKTTEYGWALTNRGSRLFHSVEQEYTHQYIDKTWRIATGNPWPERIDLY